MSTIRASLRFTAALALVLSSIADAAPIPSYQGYANAVDYSHPPVTFGGTTPYAMAYTAALSGASATSVSGSAAGGSVDATATSASGSSAGASTELVYTVDLVGPAGVYVPVHVTASGFVEGLALGATPGMSAAASIAINFNNPTSYQLLGGVTLDRTGARMSFVIDEIVMLYAGRSIDVVMDASAGANGIYGDPSFAHAFVDPTFTIDPAYASLYRLEGIPGAVAVDPPPPSGVPEPGTVALFFTGLGLATLRRRTPSPAPRLTPSAT